MSDRPNVYAENVLQADLRTIIAVAGKIERLEAALVASTARIDELENALRTARDALAITANWANRPDRRNARIKLTDAFTTIREALSHNTEEVQP